MSAFRIEYDSLDNPALLKVRVRKLREVAERQRSNLLRLMITNAENAARMSIDLVNSSAQDAEQLRRMWGTYGPIQGNLQGPLEYLAGQVHVLDELIKVLDEQVIPKPTA